MESVAEAMEFFRFGNAGKTQVKYVILAFALASVVLPYGANAMPMPRKYNYKSYLCFWNEFYKIS